MDDGIELDSQFSDSAAVITGSTRGIGEAIAKRFAAAGASVVVSGRTVEQGTTVVNSILENGGEAVFQTVDVRNAEEVEQLIEVANREFGGLDILVNNAAIETDTAPDEVELDTWDDVIDTDFRAYWLAAKYAHPYLAESEHGAVVNIGSNHAVATQPKKFPYNAVKAGIDGMTRAMATAWGSDGIRVNSVNPGWTDVERVSASLTADEVEELGEIHPLGRIGNPGEVADCVLFLASQRASFVTGETLIVDGGRTAVLQDSLYLEDTQDTS